MEIKHKIKELRIMATQVVGRWTIYGFNLSSRLTLLTLCAFLFLPSQTVAQEKTKMKKLLLDISFHQVNNELPELKVLAKTKPVKKFLPVEGVDINFYFKEEKRQGFMGKLKTNMNGEAYLRLPTRFKSSWDSVQSRLFMATSTGSQEFEDAQAEVEIIKSRIELTIEEIDSIKTIRAKLLVNQENTWMPVPDVEMKLGVNRTLTDLNATEEDTFTTDFLGEVSSEYNLILPGDMNGDIVIVAKIESHDEYGNIKATQKVKWGTTPPLNESFFKRTLFSTRDKTPIWLLVFPNLIITGVWGVIIFLIFQLNKIRKIGKAT